MITQLFLLSHHDHPTSTLITSILYLSIYYCTILSATPTAAAAAAATPTPTATATATPTPTPTPTPTAW